MPSGSLYYGSYYDQRTSSQSNQITVGGLGGTGGGSLRIQSRLTVIDGRVSANGQDGPASGTRTGCGGGSGGSIWITCDELDGYGSIQARGGAGSTSGGGGSGGRVVVNYRNIQNYNGSFSLRGGTGFEDGASGTAYLEQRNRTHITWRKLIVNNEGMSQPKAVDKSTGNLVNLFSGVYNDISEVGTVTWLKESNNYTFNELVLQGNSHLAIYGNASRDHVYLQAQILTGDRSAVLHIGNLQDLHFHDVDVYFPVNTFVYPRGSLSLPNRVSLREVWMYVNGSVSDSQEYVVDRDGELHLWSGGNSEGEPEGTFVFVNISVRARGRMFATTLAGHGKMAVQCKRMLVNAGGKFMSNDVHLTAARIIVDAAG